MASPSPASKSPSPTSPSKQPEEEDEHDTSDEGDEEDEEEPQLKYERLGGDVAKVVRSDLVSVFCVGSKVIVLHNSSLLS
jgi:hypothetical protein